MTCSVFRYVHSYAYVGSKRCLAQERLALDYNAAEAQAMLEAFAQKKASHLVPVLGWLLGRSTVWLPLHGTQKQL